MGTQITTAELATELESGFGWVGDEEQLLARTMVSLLGAGEPIDAGRLADAFGSSATEVNARLAEVPGVYRDDEGRVVGLWGLSVVEMPHRLHVDDRELYAWCAWDTLFLPIVLGEEVAVESTCPTTGEPITLTVSPHGFRDVSPSSAVMSFLRPREGGFTGDVIGSFCHFVHYFASPDAAEGWVADHEGTFQISIEDGFELARFWAARVFGVEER